MQNPVVTLVTIPVLILHCVSIITGWDHTAATSSFPLRRGEESGEEEE